MSTDLMSRESSASVSLVAPEVLRHVVDVHCHPTDSEISPNTMDKLPITICAMATRMEDQRLVRDLATAYPSKVMPCFGYHPWFTHWIALKPVHSKEEHYRGIFANSEQNAEEFSRLLPLLPDPIPLEDVISDLRRNLQKFPNAMLGEVGLDRISRVPYDYFAAPRELTPFVIPFEHQLAVLEAQMELAVKLGRHISMHSVKAQKATCDLLQQMQRKYGEQWNRVSLDLHSCGFSPQMWKDVEGRHVNVFLSLSTAINSRSPNHRALLAACSPSRILAESDFHQIDQCAQRAWDMVVTIAEVKGWQVETTWEEDLDENHWGVVRHLEENWKTFQKGNHATAPKKSRGRKGV
ncbi:hypothetical protein SERLA73DRAFT_87191 [Serpula lacrymans var. lacrymans S7.3]|uniref:TatD DNase family Scn1 n=2 Tax=Serpula lacrymans var. lacrymans TaxID=341189 RepID=F8PT39_SERL3|nr:uncharacterized protein SERLADRAFT_355308 [Serpula lacrymans var. lacrymans S7.9]EGO00869.1 hypothetical protein SERLA73DRAFT_87191 [Serpula lacrymans var. lacrymans S7.3]EGO26488.1 hypothetical protein SERLADRAFT_355308 [Serpula lacrymans var. lacrymans S7.9]